MSLLLDSWHLEPSDRFIRLATHGLGLVGVYIGSEAALTLWIENLYVRAHKSQQCKDANTVSGLKPAGPAQAEPADKADRPRRRWSWPRIKRAVIDTLVVSAGVMVFVGLVVGLTWTSRRVLDVVMVSMLYTMAVFMYDVTLSIIRSPRLRSLGQDTTSPAVPFIRPLPLLHLLTFPLLSPSLALATLALAYIGSKALLPIATTAWVIFSLQHVRIGSRQSMKGTLGWLGMYTVVVPLCVGLVIWLGPRAKKDEGAQSSEASPIPEPSGWVTEVNRIFPEGQTTYIPGMLIALCLRYDWTKSLVTSSSSPTPAAAAAAMPDPTVLNPEQIVHHAESRTNHRPTFQAAIFGLVLGLIAFDSIELFTSPETIKRSQPVAVFFVTPWVMLAAFLSVWARGERVVWWRYVEIWDDHDERKGAGDRKDGERAETLDAEKADR